MASSSSSSSSSADINSNEQKRDWLDLPSDVTANILKRIGVVDILENAQKVCTAWRKVCKNDPAMWSVIKMNTVSSYEKLMCKQAVDRSQGQLADFTISFCNDELLSYVADRSKQLRRLEIVVLYGNMLRRISGPLSKFSFLEELNLYSTGESWKKSLIETAGRYCPMLKTLKVNHAPCGWLESDNDEEVAIVIGENLHELRHLELIGSSMSNIGLQAILDGCLCLETLDLRKCLKIHLKGDMGKRCFKQIKSLKLPNDSLEDSPYSYIFEDFEPYYYEDDYALSSRDLYEDDYALSSRDDPDLYEGYFSN